MAEGAFRFAVLLLHDCKQGTGCSLELIRFLEMEIDIGWIGMVVGVLTDSSKQMSGLTGPGERCHIRSGFDAHD